MYNSSEEEKSLSTSLRRMCAYSLFGFVVVAVLLLLNCLRIRRTLLPSIKIGRLFRDGRSGSGAPLATPFPPLSRLPEPLSQTPINCSSPALVIDPDSKHSGDREGDDSLSTSDSLITGETGFSEWRTQGRKSLDGTPLIFPQSQISAGRRGIRRSRREKKIAIHCQLLKIIESNCITCSHSRSITSLPNNLFERKIKIIVKQVAPYNMSDFEMLFKCHPTLYC
nr:unnamed protein product [Callosobruchus analis]